MLIDSSLTLASSCSTSTKRTPNTIENAIVSVRAQLISCGYRAWWAAAEGGYLDPSTYLTTKPQVLRDKEVRAFTYCNTQIHTRCSWLTVSREHAALQTADELNWLHLDMRKMMSERPETFKALIRSGIPDAFRGKVGVECTHANGAFNEMLTGRCGSLVRHRLGSRCRVHSWCSTARPITSSMPRSCARALADPRCLCGAAQCRPLGSLSSSPCCRSSAVADMPTCAIATVVRCCCIESTTLLARACRLLAASCRCWLGITARSITVLNYRKQVYSLTHSLTRSIDGWLVS